MQTAGIRMRRRVTRRLIRIKAVWFPDNLFISFGRLWSTFKTNTGENFSRRRLILRADVGEANEEKYGRFRPTLSKITLLFFDMPSVKLLGKMFQNSPLVHTGYYIWYPNLAIITLFFGVMFVECNWKLCLIYISGIRTESSWNVLRYLKK